MSHKPARNDPYKLVTDSILEHLSRGVVPWRRPWNRSTGRPRNFQTGRAYQGANVLLLGLQYRPSPWWLTFRQALERGGNIRKGEHGALVIKWGEHRKSVKDGDGSEEKKTVFFLRAYHVFNAVQTEGIEFPEPQLGLQLDASERLARADEIVAQMQNPPVIREGVRTRAQYCPQSDTIEMPPFERFNQPEDFHLTLFHELIHSTGHESRLARKGITKSDGFGGGEYSQEELIAEMGAAFLCTEAGIDRDHHEQSAAYLKGWLDSLRDPDHRRWIVQAANHAGRAADFIFGRWTGESFASSADNDNREEAEPSQPS